MHPSYVRLSLVPLLLAAAAPAAAQDRSAPRPTFYAGLALGAQNLPDDHEGCEQQQHQLASEARAGVALGRFALEGRVVSMANLSQDCLRAIPSSIAPPQPPPDGVVSERSYDYRVDDSAEAADLRLRFSGFDGLPLSIAAGGGWLAGPDVPYLLAGIGLRTGGRLRLAVDAEYDLYRIRYQDTDTEWQGGQVVRVVSGDRQTTWWTGVGFRFGAELRVR